MNDVGNRIVAALNAALSPPRAPTFGESCERIAGQGKEPLASKNELAALRELQAAYERCISTANANTPQAARKKYIDAQKEGQRHIRHGEPDKHDGWSLKDFEEAAHEICSAAMAEKENVSAEARLLAAPLAQKFSDLCADLAAEIEQRELEDCNRFGLSHAQSPLVAHLLETGRQVVRRVGGNGEPKSLTPFLKF